VIGCLDLLTFNDYYRYPLKLNCSYVKKHEQLASLEYPNIFIDYFSPSHVILFGIVWRWWMNRMIINEVNVPSSTIGLQNNRIISDYAGTRGPKSRICA
jgi:hypothetical protein